MGLFTRNWNKPGPGVRKDEPRKKGAKRFLEIFTRDYRDLIKINLIFCICILPTAALFILGFIGLASSVMFILSIAAAFPVGGVLVASFYSITKMLYDEPGFLWHDMKRKFLENYKQAAIPGMLCTTFIYGQLFLWTPMLFSETPQIDLVWLVAGLLLIIFFGMASPFIFIQIAYIDLKVIRVVRNSVLISLAKAPRSLMGSILGGVIWVAFYLFFPASILFLLPIIIIGFSLSWLLTLMWIWTPFDKLFEIEETIRKRNAGELEEKGPEGKSPEGSTE